MIRRGSEIQLNLNILKYCSKSLVVIIALIVVKITLKIRISIKKKPNCKL